MTVIYFLSSTLQLKTIIYVSTKYYNVIDIHSTSPNQHLLNEGDGWRLDSSCFDSNMQSQLPISTFTCITYTIYPWICYIREAFIFILASAYAFDNRAVLHVQIYRYLTIFTTGHHLNLNSAKSALFGSTYLRKQLVPVKYQHKQLK